MAKTKKDKVVTTFDRFMQSKTPQQRKEYEAGYKDFLFSEMILAAMEEDEVSVRELARLAGVSPTIVQDMRSGERKNFNTKSFFKVLNGLGFNFFLERNGRVTPLVVADKH